MRLILVLTGLLAAYIWFRRNERGKNTPQSSLNHTKISAASLGSQSRAPLPPANYLPGDDPW